MDREKRIDEFQAIEEYDKIIMDDVAMDKFIHEHEDAEIVEFYKYVIRKSSFLSKNAEENKEMINYCFVAGLELGDTKAVKDYLNQAVGSTKLDEQVEAEVQVALDLIEAKKRNKNPFYRIYKAARAAIVGDVPKEKVKKLTEEQGPKKRRR